MATSSSAGESPPIYSDKPIVRGPDDTDRVVANVHDPAARDHLPDRSGPKRKGLGPVALIFACGAALFSDGYVNANSGPTNTILALLYTKEQRGNFSQLYSSMAFAGTVVGIIIFGQVSDRIGRKVGMLFCTMWLAFFSILIAGAWGVGTTRQSKVGGNGQSGGLFAALIAYRFILGIAIGGEYPSGSVASSENTEGKDVNPRRQQFYFIASTNSMIDIGFTVATLVTLILYKIFGDNHLDWVWRLTLGFGAFPPLILLYFRTKMEEPEHFKRGAIRRNIPWMLVFKKYWVRLLGVSVCWFIYDWVSYPAGLYSSYFVEQIVPDGDLTKSLGWSTLINAFYLPGTIIGALVTDRLGPKNTMLIGLLCQAAIGFGLAGGFGSLKNNIPGIVVLYGIYVSFGEFGPGNNLGLLASKSMAPSAVRGTMYSIAAAIGKIGAFTGSYLYTQIQTDVAPEGPSNLLYYTAPFYIGSALALVSAACLYFLVPPVTQDGMHKIDAEFHEYLLANGYDMSNIGLLASEDHRSSEDSEHRAAGGPISDDASSEDKKAE